MIREGGTALLCLRPRESRKAGGGRFTRPPLIDRYTKIVLAQPGVPFPLQRLAQLYRDRDGSIASLLQDLTTRAGQAGPEQYAATVALAGALKLDGRGDEASRTYERAIEQKPSDPSALLALAHLLQDRGDLSGARTRYEQALPLSLAQADREQTLRAIMGLALDAKDFDAARRAHVELEKLSPASLFVKGELGR